jgi:hypothetical protein
MRACLTISWFVIYICTFGKLLVDISNASKRKATSQNLGQLKQLISPLAEPLKNIPWGSWPLALVPMLGITQFWTYLRLHQAQKISCRSHQQLISGQSAELRPNRCHRRIHSSHGGVFVSSV